MSRVIIIGGGIAGLAAAVHLKAGAKAHGKTVEVLLLEKNIRIGGKILTEKIDGYLVEGGPDSFLPEKVWAVNLAKHLGLEPELLPSNDQFKGTFIYSGGRLHSLPEGVMLMVPTSFWPMAKSDLISWPGKLRMGMEMFIPKRKSMGDESLASFVTRRLGRECLEKIAEPLVAGIHTSNPGQHERTGHVPSFRPDGAKERQPDPRHDRVDEEPHPRNAQRSSAKDRLTEDDVPHELQERYEHPVSGLRRSHWHGIHPHRRFGQNS